MKRFALLTILALCTLSCSTKKQDNLDLRYKIAGSDIIVDASDLLDEIPRQHLVQTASSLGVDWLYNDFAIQFRTHADFTISNYFKDVTYPESGTYYLYVRAVGGTPGMPRGNGFRIRVNDAYVDGTFGVNPGAEMHRVASFDVKKGDVAHLMITRITGNPALDCMVLSKNPNLSEKDLMDKQFPEYMVKIREYDVDKGNGAVKFGDLTGDGKTDLVAFSGGYSSYAYDNSGKLLWSWEAPEENYRRRAEFEAPGLIWDFDADGRCELVQWREDEEGEWLVMADGATGEILHKTPWPTAAHPHVYNNFRLAVANTDGKYPSSLLLYSDCGVFMTYGIYDKELKEQWRHEVKTRKDHLGHYFYAHDFDKDGIDEIVGGWRVIDAKGNIIWSRLEDIYDNHDHVDSYRFEDMNCDGVDDIVIAACDLGAQVRDAFTGELMSIAPAEHTQQIGAGYFLDGYDKPQLAAGARIYRNRRSGDPYILSQIQWIDSEGKLIGRWPYNGLNGNPDIMSGDFYGDGSEVCFWNRFLMQRDGRGKLICTGEVYHVFDFERNGAAQVITRNGSKIEVWGWKHAKKRKANDDPDFLKESMANHTHY